MSVYGAVQYTLRNDSYTMFAYILVICSGSPYRLDAEPAHDFSSAAAGSHFRYQSLFQLFRVFYTHKWVGGVGGLYAAKSQSSFGAADVGKRDGPACGADTRDRSQR
ncbi:hypothetical protein EVAR_25723_1 [Eumeta japonica]|uniref:Uncharacterized protein n=1 Tax=Eumeta variegata TaxID=151549 RepID=A0A4C1YVI9_EUMVA|nr:hypothetical protein EVAR_25723_1 [Eumeta japonica]